MMPEVDGLTFCKELKENPMTQNIVVIFLSALTENKHVVKGLSLGAVDYITKPISPSILLARLNVHTKLILNQRAIQAQIDNLIKQNESYNKYQSSLINELKGVAQVSYDAISSIEKSSSIKQQGLSVKELKYNIGISDFLLDEIQLLQTLQNNQYKTINARKELRSIMVPIMDNFSFVYSEKNIERFDQKLHDNMVTCDELLLKTLFTCLYRNAVEAAPRGSQVSVESRKESDFFLIKIHNINEISEEVLETFDQLYVTTKTTSGSGVGVPLAFLIIKKLNGELYFHSSKKHGTTFYIKLPVKSSKH
jgi:DNA-binding response OmpR family regulator